jgi:solute carrier family 35 protein F5
MCNDYLSFTHTHTNSIAPAMFFSDYAYNKGLKHTSVASSTVLVSTSCVFVLFLSVVLRLEPFRYGKVIGVLFAVLGTAMTTWQDAAKQEDFDNSMEAADNTFYDNGSSSSSLNSNLDMVYGDMYSLLAAVGYAVYSVQALVLCPQNEELYSMTLLLGYVGVICSVPLLPMALYKVYELVLNDTMSWYFLGILIIKGLLDFVVTDYLLFRAVMLTSATIANVGLGLTIPLAFAADLIFKSMAVTTLQAAGAFTVLAGFILVNWMSNLDESTSIQDPQDGSYEAKGDGNKPAVDGYDDEPPVLPYEYTNDVVDKSQQSVFI